MGVHQMEENIELLGDMLKIEDKKKMGKMGKKVFKKKKPKKPAENKRERMSSKSRKKKREKTTSVKKKKMISKKKKRNTKGSPKLIKSQSIQLLSNTGKKSGALSNQQSKSRLHEKK
jgi:SLT domain-containing protein